MDSSDPHLSCEVQVLGKGSLVQGVIFTEKDSRTLGRKWESRTVGEKEVETRMG